MLRRCTLICAAWLCTGSAVAASPSVLRAGLECQRRATPGRVLCEAEIEVEAGALVWADVLVLEAPSFAPPLRARVGPKAVFMKTGRRHRLQLALAATSDGQGVLRVRGRAVVCPDRAGTDCRAVVREAEAVVAVGPIVEAAE